MMLSFNAIPPMRIPFMREHEGTETAYGNMKNFPQA